MTFDPSAPQAARWRAWLSAALADRGVPPDARLQMTMRPHGEAAVTRLQLDLRWAGEDAERHAQVEVLVPVRRFVTGGWSGWPAYLAGIRMLRALG